jgi:DNA polymerase III epsilon subunit-like protein
LVAHNAAFDIRMLCQEMDRYSLSFQTGQKLFCTQRYFRKRVPGRPYSLDDVAAYYGVNKIINRKTHGKEIGDVMLIGTRCIGGF